MQDPNEKEDKQAKIHRIQTDLVILDADLRKNERELEDLRMKLRQDKHKRDQLELEIDENETKVRRIEGDIMIITADIKKLRKKMNLLTIR